MRAGKRTPHRTSSVTFWSSMRGNVAIQTLALILGWHIRVGNEDNIRDKNKKRWTAVQQVEWAMDKQRRPTRRALPQPYGCAGRWVYATVGARSSHSRALARARLCGAASPPKR